MTPNQIQKLDRDPSLSDAQAVINAAVNGDLLHIDGDFITALTDLADHGHTTYQGTDIHKVPGGYCVGSDLVDSAITALLRAERIAT
ncbi:hypothetical protein P1J78_20885 [Psychromarinibacter sp. C21-152]|uniref:Uncharacterized protein n=1 Tax=Psychromarinibacter sediminicola TaxID=3033385 RepID=A0AAE3TAU0_9RHOB|nr:hypothetical protein [Psychromarinibacter sediminicola]MDF0603203.1 hypothetical protein [Psychromarinibacter sediminicola]